MNTGTGSLTVLKRTTSDGSCGPVVANERPASVAEQLKAEANEPSRDEDVDVDDAGENPTSPPPAGSRAALKFCAKRSVNNKQTYRPTHEIHLYGQKVKYQLSLYYNCDSTTI